MSEETTDGLLGGSPPGHPLVSRVELAASGLSEHCPACPGS